MSKQAAFIETVTIAINKELPLAMTYFTGSDENTFTLEVCWTDRAKTIEQQQKLRGDIVEFGKRYGAIKIHDNNINTIFLTF